MTYDFSLKKERKRRLLIVEDEELNREMLSAFLEDDYDILTAENGLEAFQVLSKEDADVSLVLLDIMMPVMDGITFLKRKHEIPALADIPVIVLTSERQLEIESLRLGAIDFIKKPYESAEIIKARVWRIIELSESESMIKKTSVDSVTGLYTAQYFDLYAHARFGSPHPLDMVAIHVPNLALTNELYGDAFDKEVKKAIGGALRDDALGWNVIGTMHNEDTFLICLDHQEDYSLLLTRLHEALKQVHHGNVLRFKLGIYPCIDTSLDLHAIIHRAQDSYLSILDDHTKSIGVYDESMHERTVFEEKLVQDFDRALSCGEFKVFLQPKYDIRGEIPFLGGAEALIRWIHPELGFVNPGVFISLFERNGLIRHLDRYVYAEAVRMIQKMEKELGRQVPVSVNVSRVEIFDKDLMDYLDSLLRSYGIEKKYLHLEVTESAVADDPKELIRVVGEFRDAGYSIELDDFGSGYSSLNMLGDLPLDVMKIDLQLTRSVDKSPKNEQLVRSIVGIAKIMGLTVTAEGVETKEQYRKMKEFGCDLIQGYYFSKPLSENDFFEKARKEFVA